MGGAKDGNGSIMSSLVTDGLRTGQYRERKWWFCTEVHLVTHIDVDYCRWDEYLPALKDATGHLSPMLKNENVCVPTSSQNHFTLPLASKLEKK